MSLSDIYVYFTHLWPNPTTGRLSSQNFCGKVFALPVLILSRAENNDRLLAQNRIFFSGALPQKMLRISRGPPYSSGVCLIRLRPLLKKKFDSALKCKKLFSGMLGEFGGSASVFQGFLGCFGVFFLGFL